MNHGKFIISLDFELLWGMRDTTIVESYKENIRGVHTALPKLLDVFEHYKIAATFATVGFLFCRNKKELIRYLPKRIPHYKHSSLSPYEGHFDSVGNSAETDLYHFGSRLISLIQTYPHHETGTHTFSHYYCLEEGQNEDDFREDMESAIAIARTYGIALTSLVFPRNQFNAAYIKVCREAGIICYRGNEQSWLYKARNQKDESRFRRLFRLLDNYVNLSGHNVYTDEFLRNSFPVNIPASRFLRPYSSLLKTGESLRLNRIKSGMNEAAKHNSTYHLWWHPHNFGINQEQNFAFLEHVLQHYTTLNKTHNFTSYTMSSLANRIMQQSLI